MRLVLDYSVVASTFKPKRLKIIWNWEKRKEAPLVRVLPGKTVLRTSDVAANIVGRSLFASPATMKLSEAEDAIQKALVNESCGDFFLCGVLTMNLNFASAPGCLG